MTILDWQVIALTVTAVASLAFIVLYGAFAKWYRTEVGRALMLSELSLVALLGVSLTAYWFHYPVSDAAALAIFVTIACAACLRLYAVAIVQVVRRFRDR